MRIHRLLGRTDDMMIIRGATYLDEIEIRVELAESVFSDVTSDIESLRQRIHEALRSALGISAPIHLVELRSIPRSEGNAQRATRY